MTKADFEKCLERTLSIYAFYNADEKKFSRHREPNGYTISSQNLNLINDFHRISGGELTRLEKGAKVFVPISDF